MKMMVETTGAFMFVDPENRKNVCRHDRPCIVTSSVFMREKVASGGLKIIHSGLSDKKSSDDGFKKFFDSADGNVDLAIASYLSSIGELEEVKSKKSVGRPRKK